MTMLDEVIRELTAKDKNEQTTSEDVLVWAKRFEVQWTQAAILNGINKSQKFDKVKMAQRPKTKWDVETTHPVYHKLPCKYCGWSQAPRQCPTYGKTCAGCGKMGHFKKVCRSSRDSTVHDVEIEMAQEPQEEGIETVSINSIYLNKNQLLITAHLEMQVGKTTIEVPYKIDTSSEGNLMSLYIYLKRCSKYARGTAKKIHKR